MDMRRLFLFLIFSFSLVVLWGEWSRQNQPQASVSSSISPSKDSSVPSVVTAVAPQVSAPVVTSKVLNGKTLHVKTDVFEAEINTAGGNIERLSLLQHRNANDQAKPIVLFQREGSLTYVEQSGLLGKGLPTHNAEYQTDSDMFTLLEGKDTIEVKLTAKAVEGVLVNKTYIFHRGNYLVDVVYAVQNTSGVAIQPSAYFQLLRDSTPPEGASAFVPTYTGAAAYTDLDKYLKIDFSDIEKNKVSLPKESDNGWVGMVQHYFVSAWLPQGKSPREFYTKHVEGNLNSVGVILPMASVEPNQTQTISNQLYVGPAMTKLDEIAPGLGLTVDYGIFTVFAAPLFWAMSFLNDLVHNWGVAIVLLTVLIKLAFFPLSAASYRSMAKMSVVAPKLEKIKKQYGDDRERLNKAMMDLYKTEKINPLGGCLPMLIQIPVFIGLYWAILESVELRHAPFIGWINDLSATDPYYILPLIMGASMLIQSKLNPVPTDPIQAKVMQIMPIAFSVVFFFFPAGLVLYSIVNNVLSIGQQWYIKRAAEAEQLGAKKT
ncbi:MAG: membrane protein insertase YidC [Sideroxydans sp.]|nr:membrane protein insertase YidC [Sideroxydans sp.]